MALAQQKRIRFDRRKNQIGKYLEHDEKPERNLIAALLWLAVRDSRNDAKARAWLESQEAKYWADLLGLEAWPPSPKQLAIAHSRPALQKALGGNSGVLSSHLPRAI